MCSRSNVFRLIAHLKYKCESFAFDLPEHRSVKRRIPRLGTARDHERRGRAYLPYSQAGLHEPRFVDLYHRIPRPGTAWGHGRRGRSCLADESYLRAHRGRSCLADWQAESGAMTSRYFRWLLPCTAAAALHAAAARPGSGPAHRHRNRSPWAATPSTLNLDVAADAVTGRRANRHRSPLASPARAGTRTCAEANPATAAADAARPGAAAAARTDRARRDSAKRARCGRTGPGEHTRAGGAERRRYGSDAQRQPHRARRAASPASPRATCAATSARSAPG